MKRKKDIMSFFQRKDKVDSETEPNGSGVERARESREQERAESLQRENRKSFPLERRRVKEY